MGQVEVKAPKKRKIYKRFTASGQGTFVLLSIPISLILFSRVRISSSVMRSSERTKKEEIEKGGEAKKGRKEEGARSERLRLRWGPWGGYGEKEEEGK